MMMDIHGARRGPDRCGKGTACGGERAGCRTDRSNCGSSRHHCPVLSRSRYVLAIDIRFPQPVAANLCQSYMNGMWSYDAHALHMMLAEYHVLMMRCGHRNL